MKTLGEVLQQTETINPLQSSPESEFDYIDVSSVSNTTFQIGTTQRLKGTDAPSRARKVVRANDILFATIRPTLQRIAVVPERLDKQVCSTGYFVLRPKPGLDHRFVFYSLFTENFMEQMEKLQKGASYPAVTDGDVKAQLIPIPPIREQQRIVGVLDDAFDGVAIAKANAERNFQNARAIFESYLQSLFIENDSGWEERKLGDAGLLEIIDGDRGVNYPKLSDFRGEGYCLFLSTKNVRPNGFNFQATAFITKEKDRQLRKGKLNRDDVVLTTRGTIGNIGLYSENVPFSNVRINSGMLILRPNKRVLLSSFLFELFRSKVVKDQIRKQTTGAAQPQLPIKTLIKFTLPVPVNLDDQHALVNKIRAFETETQRLQSIYQQKLNSLDSLRKSLLHRAFTGQL